MRRLIIPVAALGALAIATPRLLKRAFAPPVREIHGECGGGPDLVYLVEGDDQIGYIKAADTQLFVPAPEPEIETEVLDPETAGERAVIENALEERFGSFEVLEFATVSPG
mgnify:CR=1 FL=1